MLDLLEDEALQLMKESDVYSFLLFPESQLEAPRDNAVPGRPLENERRSLDKEPAELEGVKLAFRHIGILNAIYDSLSFEERIGMNKFVAGALESYLNAENQDAILPSIEFHYSRTGEINKIIQYREMLGSALFAGAFNGKIVKMVGYMEKYMAYLESIGDSTTPIMCGFSVGVAAYLTGDLDWINRNVQLKYAKNPAMKENRINAYINASVNLRMALCRGRDFAEIDLCRSEYEPHGRFIDSTTYSLGLTESYESWYLAYRSEYGAALAMLEALDRRIDIKSPGTMNMDLIGVAFLGVVLYFDPSRSKVPVPQSDFDHMKQRRWDGDELRRLIDVLTLLVAKLGQIQQFVVAYWTLRGFEATILILRGRAKAGVRLLKSKLGSRKRRVEIEYLRFLLGVYYGLIGKYSDRGRAQLEMSRQIFEAMGAPVYLRWLEA
ncbi:hypothetical protein HK101_010301 [Irineochytrium annulatum]|nr:hypothetical protein HK101_010301 [Irineochytrium annulatum]